MVDPSSDDQQLLVELLAGDRSPDEPAVAARLARDPAFRAEFESLRAMEQRVEAVAQRERTLVAAALAGGPSPAALGPRTRGEAPRRPRWLLLGLAAAAVLFGSYFVFRDPVVMPRNEERPLGTAPLELVAPLALAAGPLHLQWLVGPTLRRASFDVSIIDPATAQQAVVLERRGLPGTTTEWNLTSQETAKVRPGMVWRVETVLGGRPIERELVLR